MNRVLIDTCIFSYIFKDDSRAQIFVPWLTGKIVSLSFASVAELYRWGYARSWGAQRMQTLQDRIDQYELLVHDQDLSRVWAQVMTQKGRPVSTMDAWIAATSISSASISACAVFPTSSPRPASRTSMRSSTIITPTWIIGWMCFCRSWRRRCVERRSADRRGD